MVAGNSRIPQNLTIMKLRTFPPHSFGGQTAGPGDQQGRDGGGEGG